MFETRESSTKFIILCCDDEQAKRLNFATSLLIHTLCRGLPTHNRLSYSLATTQYGKDESLEKIT